MGEIIFDFEESTIIRAREDYNMGNNDE